MEQPKTRTGIEQSAFRQELIDGYDSRNKTNSSLI